MAMNKMIPLLLNLAVGVEGVGMTSTDEIETLSELVDSIG